MHKRITVVLSAILLLTGCSAKIEYNEPKSVDNTVYTRESAGIRLQDDFYGYTNFDLLYGNDIPADMYEWSYGQLVGRQVDEILSNEIRSLAESDISYPTGSDEQKISDLYRQYLDTAARDKVGLAPLENGLTVIDDAQTAEELVNACGILYLEYGVSVLPAVGVTQNYFYGEKNITYLAQMELFYSAYELLNSKGSAEELQEQMTVILEELGHQNAEAIAYDTVTLLLDIAESTADTEKMTIEDMYNIRTPDELDPLIARYFEAVGINGREIVVPDTGQLEKICSLLTNENIALWKALAKCELVYAYKDYLPQNYSESLIRGDKRTEEEKAVGTVKTLLAGEVGNIYAHKYLDEKTPAAVKAMTDDIISAYRSCIERSELLSENDRAVCLAKIENITVNIGCPDEDYHSSSVVSWNLLESIVSIKSAAVKDNLANINTAPMPTDWYMTPQTFNALYRLQSNSITVPMATFNAPFFDINAVYYTNLGGLGFIIAHEIGHAFDANGILYDEYGNYRPERISAERTDILSEEISAYFGSKQIMDTFCVNGERTKGENAADLGGMQVISSMTDDKDDLRKIYESYAHIWTTLSFDTDLAEQIADDVHSPAEIRVNAVLSSVDKFYDVYDISEGDGMYVPPDERVRVW